MDLFSSIVFRASIFLTKQLAKNKQALVFIFYSLCKLHLLHWASISKDSHIISAFKEQKHASTLVIQTSMYSLTGSASRTLFSSRLPCFCSLVSGV